MEQKTTADQNDPQTFDVNPEQKQPTPPANQTHKRVKNIVVAILILFGGIITIFVTGFVLLLLAFSGPPLSMHDVGTPTTTAVAPNVGYTIYAPTAVPRGYELADGRTESFGSEVQYFQELFNPSNNQPVATVRQAKLDATSQGYWVCSDGCSKIGQDQNGRTIYKSQYPASANRVTWGEKIGETFINLETYTTAGYTDADASALLGTLRPVVPSKDSAYIPSEFQNKITLNADSSRNGIRLTFKILMTNGGKPFSNQPAKLIINGGTGPGRSPVQTIYLTTDKNGQATAQTKLPWELASVSYDFEAFPETRFGNDITDMAGSTNIYTSPSGALLAVGACVVLGLFLAVAWPVFKALRRNRGKHVTQP
ncbi:MAG TPA: hypothetical protein VLG11_00355 [Candidatus Saccharimonadales bacterium]|nr:hypothetical protein [Candidatus Saccharimonadales bacterium]